MSQKICQDDDFAIFLSSWRRSNKTTAHSSSLFLCYNLDCSAELGMRHFSSVTASSRKGLPLFNPITVETGQRSWVILPFSHSTTTDGSAVLHKEGQSSWQSGNTTFPLMTWCRGKNNACPALLLCVKLV